MSALTVEQKLAAVLVAAHYLLHRKGDQTPMSVGFAIHTFDSFVHDKEVEDWVNKNKPEELGLEPPAGPLWSRN